MFYGPQRVRVMNHDARLVRNLQGNSNNVCRVKNLFARFQNALCLLYNGCADREQISAGTSWPSSSLSMATSSLACAFSLVDRREIHVYLFLPLAASQERSRCRSRRRSVCCLRDRKTPFPWNHDCREQQP